MKLLLKKLMKYFFVYIILVLTFICSLTAVALIPSSFIKEKTVESSKILIGQNNLYFIPIFYKNISMRFNNFTDALMVNTAYSLDYKHPFTSIMLDRKNYIEGVTKNENYDTAKELKSDSKLSSYDPVGDLLLLVLDDVTDSYEYARYWHGYLVFLKPLLIIFNITQIRWILISLLGILGICLLYLLAKKKGLPIAIIFLCGFIISDYFYMGNSLEGVSVFLITSISCVVMLLKDIKCKTIFFMIIGGVTCFFDFLTVPIVTLGMPLLIYILLNEDKTPKELFINIIKYCFSWGSFFILVWITKWILVDLIYSRNLINTVFEQFLYRSNGSIYENPNLWFILYENIFMTRNTLVYSFDIVVILLVIKYIKLGGYKNIKLNIKYSMLYILIGMFGILWYCLLQQHSDQHFFFTYRNFWLISTGMLLGIYNLFKKDKIYETENKEEPNK